MVGARALVVRVLLLQVFTLGLLFNPTPASANEGCDWGYGFNWGVTAAPNVDWDNARGNDGSATVKDMDLRSGSMHVESLYIWHDFNDFVEFGWKIAQGIIFRDRWVFDSRGYSGVTDSRDLQHDPSLGNHSFRLTRFQGDGFYHFEFDGNFYPNVRTPPFTGGHPVAASEVRNQCDPNHANWWSLNRKRRDNTWTQWNGTHWNCDTATHYGYDAVSNTAFGVSARSDRYAGRCDLLN